MLILPKETLTLLLPTERYEISFSDSSDYLKDGLALMGSLSFFYYDGFFYPYQN